MSDQLSGDQEIATAEPADIRRVGADLSAHPAARTDAEGMSVEMWQGPLPSPQALSGYGLVQGDLPERIMVMAEQQAAHRMEMDRAILKADSRAVDSEHANIRRGQIFGFTVTAGLLVSGLLIVRAGYPVTGGILSIAPVPLIIAAFVGGKFSQQPTTIK